jgi:hypothetical protein
MAAVARATGRARPSSHDRLIQSIANEYRAMPGLRLTRCQFRRLWNLDQAECDAVVTELVGGDRLAEGADGRLEVRR